MEGGLTTLGEVRETGEYLLAPPRRVTQSRRGEGVAEYQVRVTPPPPRVVRDTYNATKSTGHPRLKPTGFVVLCSVDDDIGRRLEFIRDHTLSRLTEITIDLHDEA